MLQLQKNDFEDLNTKLDEMANKTGAAESAWNRYKETLSAIWDTFKNTVGNQLILIGEQLAPLLKQVVSTVNEWLTANRKLITAKIAEWIENFHNTPQKKDKFRYPKKKDGSGLPEV